jgi:phospholipid/cholesterol/gamma-HCH transport system substrate-binding protein
LQQSLANVNIATGNLADDTEALKHEFFFKGFFKKRGYDSLEQLPIEPYRNGKLFSSAAQSRQWISASSLFQRSADGVETLSPAGQAQIDEAISQIPGLYDGALVVEGYAVSGTAGEELFRSRQRAIMVRAYLDARYKVGPKNTGIIGLSSTPPVMAGRSSWDGVCLVHLVMLR